MKFLIIFAIICIFQSINGQKTSTTPTPTTSAQWIDPHQGGKWGNPGANIHLSGKALDQLHAFVADQLARRIQTFNMTDFDESLGSGRLYIRSPRFVESKFGKYEKHLVPSNRVNSEFYDGKFVLDGEWEFKPAKRYRISTQAMNGTFKATVINAMLETVVQLSRKDNKPIVEIVDCKANLSQYRVDIKGAGDLTMIEKCNSSYDATCKKIRIRVEDAICQQFRSFMKDFIDTRLATFPALIEISKDFKINYALLTNQPKVTDFDIQSGLEGKAIWYGQSSVPFNPQPLDFNNRSSMVMFELGDYAFNTLLHQVHAQGYKYSAAELLSKSPSINDTLLLNCSTTQNVRKPAARGIGKPSGVSNMCLGTILENITNFDHQQLGSMGDVGDLVFKSSNRAPAIIVSKSQSRFIYRTYRAFDGSNGVLEIYGPTSGQNQQRKLLAKADIRALVGEFVPKLNKVNITGSIKITKLELAQSSAQTRSIGNEWLVKLQEFAQPLLADMFNAFFERYLQFPVPMLAGFECINPELTVMARTMQVNCDVRAMTRSGKSGCGDFYYGGNWYYYDCDSGCTYSYSEGLWYC